MSRHPDVGKSMIHQDGKLFRRRQKYTSDGDHRLVGVQKSYEMAHAM